MRVLEWHFGKYGETSEAIISLSQAERDMVRRGAVNAIYYPGGLMPYDIEKPGPVRFGGPCFVDSAEKLRGCIDQFQRDIAAYREFDAARRERCRRLIDEQAGYDAHRRIWGRLMDALRGTKSYPDMPRCPYRRADRIEAWERGLSRAHEETLKSFYADMDEEAA